LPGSDIDTSPSLPFSRILFVLFVRGYGVFPFIKYFSIERFPDYWTVKLLHDSLTPHPGRSNQATDLVVVSFNI